MKCLALLLLLIPALIHATIPGEVFLHAATREAAKKEAESACALLCGWYKPCAGGSMGAPTEYLNVAIIDFRAAKVGDRVSFVAKVHDLGFGYPPITKIICHRVSGIEKDGTLRVTGDVYPWRTDYVTPKNYLGTTVMMIVWDKP